MKLRLNELRQVVRQVLAEEAVVLTTKDGAEWQGDRQRITQGLVRFGASSAERAAIISGQVQLSPSALSSLRSQGVIQRIPKPVEYKPYDWGKEDRIAQRKRASLEKAYGRAIKEFVKSFTSFREEMPDVAPEDAAHDLADNFFNDHPEWRDWARALGMSRSGMKGAVTDYVYDAMMNGKG